MAHEVSELERLAGLVMAVERITFTEALLRVSEQYPLLRDAALRVLRQSQSTIVGRGEPGREDEESGVDGVARGGRP
jgi:hypothetical protein